MADFTDAIFAPEEQLLLSPPDLAADTYTNAIFAAEEHLFYGIPDGVDAYRDLYPPRIDNAVPAPSKIGVNEPFMVSIHDESALAFHVLLVRYPDAYEVAWDGVEFGPAYATLSSRVAIGGGYRYTLARAGGWRAPPLFRIWAVDRGGNVT